MYEYSLTRRSVSRLRPFGALRVQSGGPIATADLHESIFSAERFFPCAHFSRHHGAKCLVDFQHQPNFRAEVPSGISIAVQAGRVAFTIESEHK
jgi:hypothetical protein